MKQWSLVVKLKNKKGTFSREIKRNENWTFREMIQINEKWTLCRENKLKKWNEK